MIPNESRGDADRVAALLRDMPTPLEITIKALWERAGVLWEGEEA